MKDQDHAKRIHLSLNYFLTLYNCRQIAGTRKGPNEQFALPPMPGRQSIMALESTPSLADCILLVGHVVDELV